MSSDRAPYFPRLRVLLRICALAALAGCTDASGPEVVERVKVTLPVQELVVGDTARGSAVAVGASGLPLTDRPPRWYSSNPRAATVSHEGLVTAVSPGRASITAVVEGRGGAAEVSVIDVPIGRIDVVVGDVPIGGPRGIEAYVYDRTGVRIWHRPVRWTLSDTTLATVVSTGPTTAQLWGRAPGRLVVTGTIGGVSASGAMTVR